MLSWLFLCLLFALCGVLGFLQYRWIGEVSTAARERMRGSLQASLMRLSQEFNSDIASACGALMPSTTATNAAEVEQQLVERFHQWQPTARQAGLLRKVALAVPRQQTLELRFLNLQTGAMEPGEWPGAWSDVRSRMEASWGGLSRSGGRPPGFPPEGEQGSANPESGLCVDVPIFSGTPPQLPPAPPVRREVAWMVIEIDPRFARDTLLPDLVRRHLGAGGESDYQVTVVTRSTPPVVLYESDRGQSGSISRTADASVFLFDMGFDIFRGGPQASGRRGPGGNGPGPRGGEPDRRQQGMGSRGFGGRGPSGDNGRWSMIVRHRAGSLEAVVSRTRRANLAVTAAVLLLMMASVAALMRYTRRAQRLAELQMDFVAGVSHELRTPLTVIHTAAYNLQGKLASQPQQVERYGALIQKESGRLKALVEQIMRFAGIEAGRAIESSGPVSVEDALDAAIEHSKAATASAGCRVEKRVAPELPPVLGDAVALSHVVANLIGNAAKYGQPESAAPNGVAAEPWIGVSAAASGPGAVEIRVTDRGRGIPRDELKRVFDPFFRGARARNAQIHGTGLGLSISRKIVEAHGGTISVRSEPMHGTEFTVRLPAMPAESPAEGSFTDEQSPGGAVQ